MRELEDNEVAVIEKLPPGLKVGELVEYTFYFRVKEIAPDGVIGEILPKVEWHKIVNNGHGPVACIWRGRP